MGRTRARTTPRLAVMGCFAAALAACATGSGPSGGPGGASSGGAGGQVTGGAGGAGLEGGGGTINLGGAGGGPDTPIELYVHTNTTLFRADPAVMPFSLAQVGAFDCLGGEGQDTSMTDLAVSEAGELWAVSKNKVYRLELVDGVAHCAEELTLDKPDDVVFFGLAFAPKGVLDDEREVLVAGNTAGELWAVAEDGTLEQRGTLGVVPTTDGHGHVYAYPSVAWELSGDLIFLANDGDPIGFATVRDCPNPPSEQGCSTIDTLLELDLADMKTATTNSVAKVVRGALVEAPDCPIAGPGQFGRVYGIAAYQGVVLGFARSEDSATGYAVSISNQDGSTCVLDTYESVLWAGAGITTVAPVLPPN